MIHIDPSDGVDVYIPQRIWTGNGKVYYQAESIGARLNNDNNLEFQYPNDYYYLTTFDTNGRLEQARYYMDGTPASTNDHLTFAAKWYTRGRNGDGNTDNDQEMMELLNVDKYQSLLQTGDLSKIMWMLLGTINGMIIIMGYKVMLRFCPSANKSTEIEYATITTPLIQ